MKKLLAMLLAVLMLASLTVTAFADDELGSIEVGTRPGIVHVEGFSQEELLPSASARRII